MSSNLKEETLIAAGLLDEAYDPETEREQLEPGDEPLTAEDRKELLQEAEEALLDVKGRISRLTWEGAPVWEEGKACPMKGQEGLVIRHIFASPRENLPIAYSLGDVRVYCEPKQSLPGDGFRLFVINRMSPASLHSPMTRSSFVEEVSEELRWQLREKCFACSKPVEHDDEDCPACGQDLEDDGEDEAGGGDPTGEPGEPAATSPGSAVVS